MILPREIIPSSSFFKGSLSQGLVELRAKSGKQAGLGVRRNTMRGSHAVVGGRISFYSQCSTFCFPHFRNLTLESEWQCPPSIWLLNGKISICTLRILHCQLGLPEDYQRINTCTLNVPSSIQTWFAGKSKIYFDDFLTSFSTSWNNLQLHHWGIFHGIFPGVFHDETATGDRICGYSSLSILWDFSWSSLGYRLKPWWFWALDHPYSYSKFSYQRPFMNLGRP